MLSLWLPKLVGLIAMIRCNHSQTLCTRMQYLPVILTLCCYVLPFTIFILLTCCIPFAFRVLLIYSPFEYLFVAKFQVAVPVLAGWVYSFCGSMSRNSRRLNRHWFWFLSVSEDGQWLKVSSDRLGEVGNRSCDPWFTRHRFNPYTTAAPLSI